MRKGREDGFAQPRTRTGTAFRPRTLKDRATTSFASRAITKLTTSRVLSASTHPLSMPHTHRVAELGLPAFSSSLSLVHLKGIHSFWISFQRKRLLCPLFPSSHRGGDHAWEISHESNMGIIANADYDSLPFPVMMGIGILSCCNLSRSLSYIRLSRGRFLG